MKDTLKTIIIGLIVTVLGGVIVAYLIQDARFKLSETPVSPIPSAIQTSPVAITQTQASIPTLSFTLTTPSSPSLYTSFDDATYDGQYDKSLWLCDEGCNSQNKKVYQQDGSLHFEVISESTVNSIGLKSRPVWTIDEIMFLEGRLRFDESAESGGLWLAAGEANCFLRVADISSKRLVFQCGFVQESGDWQYATDETAVDFGRWYTMQIVFDHETNKFLYYLDRQLIGEYIPRNPKSVVQVRIGAWTDTTRTFAYVDDIALKTKP